MVFLRLWSNLPHDLNRLHVTSIEKGKHVRGSGTAFLIIKERVCHPRLPVIALQESAANLQMSPYVNHMVTARKKSSEQLLL